VVVVGRAPSSPFAGITCGSCASRVDRRLNELDGVGASVNHATEQAAVAYDGLVSISASCAPPPPTRRSSSSG
jgi:cation transport ATPase